MGLDQYAYAVMPHKDNTDTSFVWNSENNPDNYKELIYWRKHPNLHGWMENLYRSKGGTDQFNCRQVRLTFKDLQDLEDNINGKQLPHTEGFFFGSDADEHYRDQDLDFVKQARKAMSQDMEVYYDSWW